MLKSFFRERVEDSGGMIALRSNPLLVWRQCRQVVREGMHDALLSSLSRAECWALWFSAAHPWRRLCPETCDRVSLSALPSSSHIPPAALYVVATYVQ